MPIHQDDLPSFSYCSGRASLNEPISGSDDDKYQEVLEGKTDKQDVADGSESCSSPLGAESPDWLNGSDVDFGSSDSNSEEGGSDSSDYSSI